jgi:hypothetical protein
MFRTVKHFWEGLPVAEFLFYPGNAAMGALLEFPPVFQSLPQGQVISIFQLSTERQTTG